VIIPFTGFIPDADYTVAGAITDCEMLLPTERGMAAAPSLVNAVDGLAALPFEARGIAVMINTEGVRRIIAGTTSSLYELAGSTWNAVQAGFTGSSDNRWSFAQFGNAALAFQRCSRRSKSPDRHCVQGFRPCFQHRRQRVWPAVRPLVVFWVPESHAVDA
jgi:hypothetical protein